MGLSNLNIEQFLVEFEILKNQIAISLHSTGLIGFWDRIGTALSPKTAGDDIETTGDVTADTLLADSIGINGAPSTPYSAKITGLDGVAHAGWYVGLFGGDAPAVDDAGMGIGYAGGYVNIVTGEGGASSGDTEIAGKGGQLTVLSGAGGIATASGTKDYTGGIGGAFSLTGGIGGSVQGTTTGTATAGAGGGYTMSAGAGSNAIMVGGVNNAGAGGPFTLTGGAGGTSVGGGTAGAGGDLTFKGGIGGTGYSGSANGLDGLISFEIGGGTIVGTFLADKSGFQQNDGIKIFQGTGPDVSMNFDGSDWIFNPREVGTGDGYLQYDWHVTEDLTVGGNITSANVFIPQYIFSHTNKTMAVITENNWTNATFDQEVADIKFGIQHNSADATNTTFTIIEDGIYEMDYDFDIEDTSVGASTVDVAGRIVYINGTEVVGSVFETDITKNGVGAELSHDFLIIGYAGDQFKFQFIGSDPDVVISTHGTFGVHPESATIVIKKVANL